MCIVYTQAVCGWVGGRGYTEPLWKAREGEIRPFASIDVGPSGGVMSFLAGHICQCMCSNPHKSLGNHVFGGVGTCVLLLFYSRFIGIVGCL